MLDFSIQAPQKYSENTFYTKDIKLAAGSSLACSAGILLGQVHIISLWSFIWLAMFDWESEEIGGGRGYLHPSPYFWLYLTPLVQISFPSQPSTAIKIKHGGYKFC